MSTPSVSSASLPTRARPKLLRALGGREPPARIHIDGQTFQRVEVYKHDSWAATALYRSGQRQVVCKFNRTQRFGIIPGRWIGRFLAARERKMYQRLADVPAVPPACGPVVVKGRCWENVAAHAYVPGQPLRWHHRPTATFFLRLKDTLDSLHRRRVAYVDLNKLENIILGDDGNPYLIDFQISIHLPRIWPLSVLLRVLQQCDQYHFQKHLLRLRPDMQDCADYGELMSKRPWWLSLHRRFGAPIRQLRRRLLVLLGVRRGDGKVQSEQFVEHALRPREDASDPLLLLQQTLSSDAYYQSKGGCRIDYIEGMFRDLFQRDATAEDCVLLFPLRDGRSRQEIAAVLLRAPELFSRSDGLSDEWAIRTNLRLREEILGDQ